MFLFQWRKTGICSGEVTSVTDGGIGLGGVAALGLRSPPLFFTFIINIVTVAVCFLMSLQFPLNCSGLSP